MFTTEKRVALSAFGHSDSFTSLHTPGVRKFTLGVDGHTDSLTLSRGNGQRGFVLRLGGKAFGFSFGKRRD